MDILFSSTKIGDLNIGNRFVRSATYDAGAEYGFVSDWQIKLYSALARGDIGLIISGAFCVNTLENTAPTLALLTDDKFVTGLRNLSNAVHDNGSLLAVQLYHPGREAFRGLKPLGIVPWGPSAVKEWEDPYFGGCCAEMAVEEIWSTINAFADAARRARDAGCDAVQVHGAHAYLLGQFLSPHSNHRKDEWGGKLDNRMKIHKEIYGAIRSQVGPNFPVMIKLGVADCFPGGLQFEEGVKVAAELARIGYDCIEVSSGLRGIGWEQTEFRHTIVGQKQEAYFREWAKQVRRQVSAPVMMVGGLRSMDVMRTVIEAREADFVCLCRPFVREPDLVASWARGLERYPTCVSCNLCFSNVVKGNRLQCMMDRS